VPAGRVGSRKGGFLVKAVSPDQDLLEALNAVALEEAELLTIIDNVNRAYDAGACSVMVARITQKKLAAAAPGRSRAILARLQALAAMMDGDEMKCWIQPGGTSVTPSARRALVAAAADHPLCMVDGAVAFEKESFRRRILELVEPEGGTS